VAGGDVDTVKPVSVLVTPWPASTPKLSAARSQIHKQVGDPRHQGPQDEPGSEGIRRTFLPLRIVASHGNIDASEEALDEHETTGGELHTGETE
jgi:hypothetical protein